MRRALRWSAVWILLCLALVAPLAADGPPDRLDPALRLLLDAGAQAVGPGLGKALALPGGGPTAPVSTLVLLTPGAADDWLPKAATLRARVGDVAAVSLPLAQVAALAQAPQVRYVQADRAAFPLNDLSVPDTGAPLVHSQGVRGEGVIVGLIDSGIDWTHPDFGDEQGGTRIKALLDLSDPGDRDGDGTLDGPVLGGTLYTAGQLNAALQDNGLALQGGGAAIPDNDPNGVFLPVRVDGEATVRSLAVTLRIRHPDRTDLVVTLITPGGAYRPLLPYHTSHPGADIRATFDVPDFNGQSARGSWWLHVADLAPGQVGQVESWTLHLNQVVREADRLGHGTHVAGTAAGNGLGTGNGAPAGTYAGMAPRADLVVVKATRQDDGAFYESDQLTALAFIERFATQAGQPFVVNLSLGTQFGAHDGTAASEVAIDQVTAGRPGRAVVVAAGNDGDDDIHAGATVGPGQTVDFAFDAPAGFFLAHVWFSGQDRVRVGFRQPSGALGPGAAPGQSLGCRMAEAGARVCVYLGGPHPLNGAYDAQVYFYLATAGRWAVTLRTESAQPARVDAWAVALGTRWTSGVEAGRRLTIPGTARNALTVGAYTTRESWQGADGQVYATGGRLGELAPFSSDGPTRDGRLKPDLAAPGQAIISTLSTAANPSPSAVASDGRHVVNQGTSMAAPHVTGAIALLFRADPTLSTAGLRSLLTVSTRRDGQTGPTANPRWGAGRLNVAEALTVLRLPRPFQTFLPLIYVYGTR